MESESQSSYDSDISPGRPNEKHNNDPSPYYTNTKL